MLSLCVINRRQNRELEKKQEKTTSIDETEKVEVKLHVALVLNITYWAIYEPRRDAKGCIAQRTWQGFQRQSELNFFLRSNPARKITLYRS